MFPLLQAAAHHCSICWAPGAPLPHFLVVLQMGPAQHLRHTGMHLQTASVPCTNTSQTRQQGLGGAEQRVSQQLTSLLHQCGSTERCGYKKGYSTELAPRTVMSRTTTDASPPEASRGGNVPGIPPPFAHRVNAPLSRTSRVLAKPREGSAPSESRFFSGCRQTCVKVPHCLQHCGVEGAYLGRPSWPAATRIALEETSSFD